MKDFLAQAAPLNRAIVSDGFDKTLSLINDRIGLTIHEYKSGTQCFDWIIPRKWIMRGAYIETNDGKRILDWSDNPLHVVVGSLPLARTKVTKDELLKRIHTNKNYPDAVPYQFKYYELDWGFCLAHNDLKNLTDEEFWVEIDSGYEDGFLKVGEHVIEGEREDSIVLLSHVDHPGQVNDGLAGAGVMLQLAERLRGKRPTYTIRMHFLPETIGSIAYLHHNRALIPKIIGAIFCEMPGTPEYPMVLQYSRHANSRLDTVAARVLRDSGEKVEYGECFKHVKNDDGFYNSPGIDIPCISLSRSKKLVPGDWHHFPYYHTSGDSIERFDFPAAERYLDHLEKIIATVNTEKRIVKKYRGVPNLSRHGLWIDWRVSPLASQAVDSILFNLDDDISIADLAERTDLPEEDVEMFVLKLAEKGLVELSV